MAAFVTLRPLPRSAGDRSPRTWTGKSSTHGFQVTYQPIKQRWLISYVDHVHKYDWRIHMKRHVEWSFTGAAEFVRTNLCHRTDNVEHLLKYAPQEKLYPVDTHQVQDGTSITYAPVPEPKPGIIGSARATDLACNMFDDMVDSTRYAIDSHTQSTLKERPIMSDSAVDTTAKASAVKRPYAKPVEVVTFIYGVDMQNMSDNDIYSALSKLDAEIKMFDSLEVKPKRILKRITDLKDQRVAIITALDEREEQ